MIARLRKSMEEKDQGSTLIELLVVIVIIGILATPGAGASAATSSGAQMAYYSQSGGLHFSIVNNAAVCA